MLKAMVKDRGVEDDFEIASAATSAEESGNPVYPPAKAQLAKHGISCEGKRARRVTLADYDHYDFLLCADERNIRNLGRIVGPDQQRKVHLILDYAERAGGSISDPWYSGDFEATYRDLEEGLEGFLRYLGY